MIDEQLQDRLFAKMRKLEAVIREALDQLEEETPDGEAVWQVRMKVKSADAYLTEIFEMCWEVEKR